MNSSKYPLVYISAQFDLKIKFEVLVFAETPWLWLFYSVTSVTNTPFLYTIIELWGFTIIIKWYHTSITKSF